jgi:D-alanyl-D-alanine carboxypeptidase
MAFREMTGGFDLNRAEPSRQEGHELLDPRYTDMLTTGKVNTPGGGGGGGVGRYAFGFEDNTINGIRCFGHGGGAPGMNGDLAICPTAGYVVAVLANTDPPAAGRISQFITSRLPER